MTARRFAPGQPVAVTVHPRTGAPLGFCRRGRFERVEQVVESWEVVEGWWRGLPAATQRRYYRLRARSGLLCVLYRDLDSGRWFLERIYD